MSNPMALQIMTDSSLHLIAFSDGSEFTVELMGVFDAAGDDQQSINMAQKASADLKAKLEAFVEKYGSKVPQLHGFRKTIIDLDTDTYFLLIPYEFESSLHKLQHEEILASLNGAPLFTAESEEAKHAFTKLLSKYDVTNPPNNRRTVLGERNPERKKCRFCGRTKQDGARFKKIAHAISEGLGNKNIVVSDECDDCNEFFGIGIEPALIELFNLNRTYLGTKGKNGHPKIIYKNGSFTHDGSMMLIQGRKIDDDGNGRVSVSLGTSQPFAPADCYKALCKFAISVIKAEELEHLGGTIGWLRSTDVEQVPLPKIATCILPFPGKAPDIVMYTRRDDSRLPHVVCEFKLGPFVYVYMLPFSRRDKDDPGHFFEDPEFTELFSHYRVGHWRLQDFSSTLVRPLDATLNLVPSDGGN